MSLLSLITSATIANSVAPPSKAASTTTSSNSASTSSSQDSSTHVLISDLGRALSSISDVVEDTISYPLVVGAMSYSAAHKLYTAVSKLTG